MNGAREPPGRGQIILYTQAGCEDSARARAWLTEHGVAVLECDVTADPAAARALYETGTFATPLLLAGNAKVLGFRPRELAAALGGRAAPRGR